MTVPVKEDPVRPGRQPVEQAPGSQEVHIGEGAGPLDVYSLRQPLGVVAGITLSSFPAMIPLWKAAPETCSETCSGPGPPWPGLS